MHFVLFIYYQQLKLILYFQFILNAFTNILLLLNHIYLFVYVLVYSELIYWLFEWLLVGPYIVLELLQINSNPSKHKWHQRMWIFPDPTRPAIIIIQLPVGVSLWQMRDLISLTLAGSRRRVMLSDAVEWLMEPAGDRLRDGLASLRGITHAGELLHQRRVWMCMSVWAYFYLCNWIYFHLCNIPLRKSDLK